MTYLCPRDTCLIPLLLRFEDKSKSELKTKTRGQGLISKGRKRRHQKPQDIRRFYRSLKDKTKPEHEPKQYVWHFQIDTVWSTKRRRVGLLFGRNRESFARSVGDGSA
ncbi:hypothetical protein EVAR_42393_1 [Eumeta japonica]|uniref:Uncharacterized protein n=1 Tax=Eumeta variegata TaxID=151549 RepID=A0A4C1YJC1_EUMVA|nr:hypothetical protein EVAR_42393_1 [Eumeta japonica]